MQNRFGGEIKKHESGELLKMTKTIKQDVNFLEYPLWIPKERDLPKTFEMTDIDGFKFESFYGVPGKVDILILYFLLLESQDHGYKRRLKLSAYHILKGCGIAVTQEKKERLKTSLEKWKRVVVSFAGTFYDGKNYGKIEFNIIDAWKESPDKKNIEIVISEDWLCKIQHSNFFKLLSFSEMRQLRSPIALRLFEILSKSFHKREVWQISAHKLADKIPLSTKFYSQITRQIIPAVKIISQKTSLNIQVEVNKTGKNEGVFVFRKVKKNKPAIKNNDTFIEDRLPIIHDAAEVMGRFTDQELEVHREKFIAEKLSGNKYLQKLYHAKGFAAGAVNLSFVTYLNKLKQDQDQDRKSDEG